MCNHLGAGPWPAAESTSAHRLPRASPRTRSVACTRFPAGWIYLWRKRFARKSKSSATNFSESPARRIHSCTQVSLPIVDGSPVIARRGLEKVRLPMLILFNSGCPAALKTAPRKIRVSVQVASIICDTSVWIAQSVFFMNGCQGCFRPSKLWPLPPPIFVRGITSNFDIFATCCV